LKPPIFRSKARRISPRSNARPYRLPRKGTTSLPAAKMRFQSMSNIWASGDSAPHSNTESHEELFDPPMPAWFRNDVHDEAEPGGLQGVGESVEARQPAKFRIYRTVIDSVIAVRRAWLGGLNGRQIDMADSELRQIRHGAARFIETEIPTHLKPIGRSRRRGRQRPTFANVAARSRQDRGEPGKPPPGSNIVSTSSDRRRRQFGCASSDTPGRLA